MHVTGHSLSENAGYLLCFLRSHATIRVELCNRGGHRVLFNPYKPEIFGDKIIVEKRIDCQNSSKLLLRDVRGQSPSLPPLA